MAVLKIALSSPDIGFAVDGSDCVIGLRCLGDRLRW